MACFFSLHAQWVDDPMTNTLVANCDNSSAELLVATSPEGGTFVQWLSMSENGWSPKLQYVDHEGYKQWGRDGIRVTTPNLATWSPGYALAATTDGAVVSMFRTADAHHWVVKVNPDGSTPWGTDGMMLFDGEGGGRSELLADKGGGFWALGTDMDNSFLQYVNADGTLMPMITLSIPTKKCTNGKLIPSSDGVFVVYAKQTLQGYTNYNKEICLAKYDKNGEQLLPETLLFEQQTIGASYVHYAIPDGLGGAYVYQWHNAIGGAYNTYVTHFDENGTPTITEPNGIPVHSPDPNNFYINAYPTIDPITHDLVMVYRQTEAYSQTQYKLCVNRITMTGEKPWGDGILLLDNGTQHFYGPRIDAYELGDGFAVTYHQDVPGANAQTIEAFGLDTDGNMTWTTQVCSNPYSKTGTENSTGFHEGQCVVTWVNAQDGGLYGQNLGWDGSMGEVTPLPSLPCDPPTDFDGYGYYHFPNTGAVLSWTAPETLPLHYNLYLDGSNEKDIIEVDAESTSYHIDDLPYEYNIFRLTAVYEDCESDFALTHNGDDYLLILYELSVPEAEDEEILTITGIYNLKGQLVNTKDINELTPGVYAVIGFTSSGKTIVKKVLK